MMLLSTYRSPASGTAWKKSPATVSTRSVIPAVRSTGAAPDRTSGRSTSTPLVSGLACRIAASKAPRAAANINDGREAAEVVRLHETSQDSGRDEPHGFVEDGGVVGVFRQVAEQVFSVNPFERWLPSLHAHVQVGPGVSSKRHPDHGGPTS